MRPPISPAQELALRRRYDHCLAQVLSLSEQAASPDPYAQRALACIGETASVSRAYIFRFDYDARRIRNTHEWTAPDIPPLLGLEVGFDEFPFWVAQLQAGRMIVGSDIRRDLPAEAHEILTLQDIVSILVGPLRLRGRVWGFLGLDECTALQEWSPAEVELFGCLCHVMGGVWNGSVSRRQQPRRSANARYLRLDPVAATG